MNVSRLATSATLLPSLFSLQIKRILEDPQPRAHFLPPPAEAGAGSILIRSLPPSTRPRLCIEPWMADGGRAAREARCSSCLRCCFSISSAASCIHSFCRRSSLSRATQQGKRERDRERERSLLTNKQQGKGRVNQPPLILPSTKDEGVCF